MDKLTIGALITLAFFVGLTFGFLANTYMFFHAIEKNVDLISKNLKVDSVNLGFNETYIMDRFEDMVNKTNKIAEVKK